MDTKTMDNKKQSDLSSLEEDIASLVGQADGVRDSLKGLYNILQEKSDKPHSEVENMLREKSNNRILELREQIKYTNGILSSMQMIISDFRDIIGK